LLATDSLASTPFLVLGNKVDVPRAASESELRVALGLHDTTGKDATVKPPEGMRAIELFMCSIIKKQGYPEGFKWLNNYV
jgi:GTP-binding protein SAR1